MKIGDLVKHKHPHSSGEPGLVVDIIQKKCWRTKELGPMIDWRLVDPELHAVVFWSHNNDTVNMPACELEIIDESR